MKISYNLLKQFIPKLPPAETLAKLVTEHSFELEYQKKIPSNFPGIITAKVIHYDKHPNADRLRIVKLTTGDSIIEPVVCGATNFNIGDIVALALPGVKIPRGFGPKNEPFILKKAVIRGIESQGMICSAYELNLSENTEKIIMVLDPKTPIGIPIDEVLSPVIEELNALPPANRPDIHSHLGISNELAAILKQKIVDHYKGTLKVKALKTLPLKILNKKLCTKHYAIKLTNIKIQPAPNFIQTTLKELNIKSINNVVDITNYVTQIYGQPLHAFDASKVNGTMIVRNAKDHEKLLMLNNNTYEFESDILVIADEEKALDIAGVMGGKESSVSNQTTDIILVASNFEPVNIRQTAKKLGIKTEASNIFEKGIHPNFVDIGAAKALELLINHTGAKIEQYSFYNNSKVTPTTINFTSEDINNLLGLKINPKQIVNYLTRFGIKIKSQNSKSKILTATPPWWRTDLVCKEDLAEEVLKLYGYFNVKPQSFVMQPILLDDEQKNTITTSQIYNTKNFFARLGYCEVQNYGFISEKNIINFGANVTEHMEILNPLSEDQKYLKKFAEAHILKNIALNQKYFDSFKLFELAKEFLAYENEPLILMAANFSKQAPVEKLLAELKADVLHFTNSLGLEEIKFSTTENNSCGISYNDLEFGKIFLTEKIWKNNFDISGNFVICKIGLGKLLPLKKDIIFKPAFKFQQTIRDLSIIIDNNILFSQIENCVLGTNFNNVKIALELFEADFLSQDKDSLKFHQNLKQKNKKNYGIRLIFKPENHTLHETEITGFLSEIMLKLIKELGAEIR